MQYVELAAVKKYIYPISRNGKETGSQTGKEIKARALNQLLQLHQNVSAAVEWGHMPCFKTPLFGEGRDGLVLYQMQVQGSAITTLFLFLIQLDFQPL